ncbi:MAG: MoaD/ThiS family protein [Bacillati bacterium ANGP1]|uniref:MoaD/ThiS family protein n=1 Tax=Candidatus Segetimicrobium genomatis TaxID=2569760 RepID=A0A537K5E1_9BACT|nr:MAG: MoaD/ThiS family protein [Terrabacteria group bacterium ANGP1]
MAVHVRIPTPLRRITNGERVIVVSGGNLAQALEDLDRRFPGFRAKIMDDRGELLQFVNIFVNEKDIRFLSGLQTPLAEGAEVSIVPAMAGGSPPPLR